jgi:hypothetical protein
MPGTGLMTLGAAALFGISTVLRVETSDKAFRVNEVLYTCPAVISVMCSTYVTVRLAPA